jgi:hypothetical protein
MNMNPQNNPVTQIVLDNTVAHFNLASHAELLMAAPVVSLALPPRPPQKSWIPNPPRVPHNQSALHAAPLPTRIPRPCRLAPAAPRAGKVFFAKRTQQVIENKRTRSESTPKGIPKTHKKTRKMHQKTRNRAKPANFSRPLSH